MKRGGGFGNLKGGGEVIENLKGGGVIEVHIYIRRSDACDIISHQRFNMEAIHEFLTQELLT